MDITTNLQKRCAFMPSGLAMREDSEQPTVSGVAIVVNTETVLYEGSDWREIEVIDPAAITREFIDTQDIKLNLLHERNSSFARCNKGAGSLVLDTREDGLHFECPLPDCDLGKRAKALIDNGTYTGCSFEFYPSDYEVSERTANDGKTEYVIRHKAFARVGAITIGMDPAYEQTSVGLREIYREAHPATVPAGSPAGEDTANREQELRDAIERERFTPDQHLAAMQMRTRRRIIEHNNK